MTADLLKNAINSFRIYYPALPLVVFDNGSKDASIDYLLMLQGENSETTKIIFNKTNAHHGPAMDQALKILKSSYVLFLDSDTETFQSGWIESMLKLIQESELNYVVGKKIYMNKRGFDVETPGEGSDYIRPICMLIRRELYYTLPPFIKHGTPCLKNFKAAAIRNLRLIDFPVEKYVRHLGRGTASRFGYNLGWRGRLNFILNKIRL